MKLFQTIIKKLNPFTGPRSLYTQLRIWGLVFILIPSVLLILFTAYTKTAQIEEIYFSNITQALSIQQNAIETWFNERSADIKLLTKLSFVKSQDIPAMSSYFYKFTSDQKDFYSIGFVNADGIVEIDTAGTQNFSVADRDYFKLAKNGKDYITDILIYRSSGTPIIIISSPVYDYNGNLRGLVFGSVKLTTIKNIIEYFNFGKSSRILLVNKDGLIICNYYGSDYPTWLTQTADDKNIKTYNTDVLQQASQKPSGTSIYRNETNTEVLGAYRWIPAKQWLLIGEINRSEALQIIMAQLKAVTAGLISVLLISIPLTFRLSYKITSPIHWLTMGSQYVQNGIYDFAIDQKSIADAPQELQKLCDIFNRMIATIRNNTDLLELKNEALIETQAKYRNLVEESLVGVYIIQNDKLTYVNPRFCEIFGYTDNEVIDKLSPLDLIAEEDRPITAENIFKRISGQCASIRYEVKGLKKDGSIIYTDIYGTRLGTNGKTAIIGTLLDNTQRKLAEIAAEKARDDALQASLAKTQFLSTMSHEIRTPMNAIIGMSELLCETNLNEEQKRYIGIFRSAGENLLNLIDDILDLSKIEAGHIDLEQAEFDLLELIEKNCEVLSVRAEKKGLELIYQLAPDAPHLLIGDQVKLNQVITNLIGNSIKFTEHGEILLKVKLKSLCEITTTQKECILEFSVRDSGIGIAKDKLSSIFNAFTQVDSSTTRKFGGTGLGLAISKNLVELMNGTIWVESQLGVGSTFYFTAKFLVPSKPSSSSQTIDVELKGLKTLIVDDNATNRLILSEHLSMWGADVTELDDGYKAIEEINYAINATPYQLMLLDSSIPGIDSFDLAKKLNTMLDANSLTIIMLTSNTNVNYSEKCRKSGISAYIIKPVKRIELYNTIKKSICKKMNGFNYIEQPLLQEPYVPLLQDTRALHILLVDDSADNRLLIQTYLKNTNYKIDIAEDGKKAVDLFMRNNYHLVLMDMQMPIMDGYTATKTIREWEISQLRTPVPIIAITAFALSSEYQKSLDAGCSAHLNKPLKKKTLLDSILEYTRSVKI